MLLKIKLNLLSICIPSSSNLYFSGLNVLLVLLFLFPLFKTIAWNLSGFIILLFSVNHFTADSDSSFDFFKNFQKN